MQHYRTVSSGLAVSIQDKASMRVKSEVVVIKSILRYLVVSVVDNCFENS